MKKVRFTIEGDSPGMLQHNIDGGFVTSQARSEKERLTGLNTKARKEPANVESLRQLEWFLSMYASNGSPTTAVPVLPTRVVRGGIHTAAKLSKDGQRVNRGLQITDVKFEYGPDTGKTANELYARADDSGTQLYVHEAVVAVRGQRVSRVRVWFPVWSATVEAAYQPEVVSPDAISGWVETCGAFIGLGDWRPDKGGEFGRFTLTEFAEL